MNHGDYAVTLIDIEHVGVSPDCDGGGGIDGFNNASESLNVTPELVRRGYSERDIARLWSGNLLRVMEGVERAAQRAARMTAEARTLRAAAPSRRTGPFPMPSTRRHLTARIALATLVAVATGCGPQAGSAPAPAAAPVASAAANDSLDPTGRYELVAERGSERLVLVATLHQRADGSLAGIVSSPTAPMLTVRTGSVRGRTISMRVVADDGSEARVELVVDGERVTGRLTRDTGDFMRVTGRRLR